MNKTDDKFCPECGHHLYRINNYPNGVVQGQYAVSYLWCNECNREVDYPATVDQVQAMRERYDSQAEEG